MPFHYIDFDDILGCLTLQETFYPLYSLGNF